MITSFIEIGRIVNRHGVRGELRILPHNPASRALDGLPQVVLHFPDGEEATRRVLSARRHKRFVLVWLEGIVTANDAEALVGCRVSVKSGDLQPLGEHEVYHADLLDCTVRTEEGRELGCVCEVFATGSNDVCVVRQGEKEYLIPLIGPVVISLDVSKGEMVIRPLPGLLDP